MILSIRNIHRVVRASRASFKMCTTNEIEKTTPAIFFSFSFFLSYFPLSFFSCTPVRVPFHLSLPFLPFSFPTTTTTHAIQQHCLSTLHIYTWLWNSYRRTLSLTKTASVTLIYSALTYVHRLADTRTASDLSYEIRRVIVERILWLVDEAIH